MIFAAIDKGSCFRHGTRSRGLASSIRRKNGTLPHLIILITANSKTCVHDGVYLYGGIPRNHGGRRILPAYRRRQVTSFAHSLAPRFPVQGGAIAPKCNYSTADITFRR